MTPKCICPAPWTNSRNPNVHGSACPWSIAPLDLAAIEARAELVSAGPWEALEDAGDSGPEHGSWYVTSPAGIIACDSPGDVFLTRERAKFIAHAREDVPALIAEVRRLREEVSKIEEAKRAQQRAELRISNQRKEIRRLRKLANRRARKCNLLLSRLRNARGLTAMSASQATEALFDEIATRTIDSSPVAVENAKLRLEKYLAENPKTRFSGLSGTIPNRDLASFGEALRSANDPVRRYLIRTEDKIGVCVRERLFDGTKAQLQQEVERTAAEAPSRSGRADIVRAFAHPVPCDINDDPIGEPACALKVAESPARKFMIFTYGRNTNIIDEEKFTGTAVELRSRVEYICDASKRFDAAGYIQAFTEPVKYDDNGQPAGEPAYYRRV